MDHVLRAFLLLTAVFEACGLSTEVYNTILEFSRNLETCSGLRISRTNAGSITILSDGKPNHPIYRTNPTDFKPTAHSFNIPSKSVVSPFTTCIPTDTPLAFAINGIPMYSPISSGGISLVEGRKAVVVDGCGGRVDTNGSYHYLAPVIDCLYPSPPNSDRILVGVAIDGFPIYQINRTIANLDECGGRQESGSYAYYIMGNFPYTIGCLRGRLISSHSLRQQMRCPDFTDMRKKDNVICPCPLAGPDQRVAPPHPGGRRSAVSRPAGRPPVAEGRPSPPGGSSNIPRRPAAPGYPSPVRPPPPPVLTSRARFYEKVDVSMGNGKMVINCTVELNKELWCVTDYTNPPPRCVHQSSGNDENKEGESEKRDVPDHDNDRDTDTKDKIDRGKGDKDGHDRDGEDKGGSGTDGEHKGVPSKDVEDKDKSDGEDKHRNDNDRDTGDKDESDPSEDVEDKSESNRDRLIPDRGTFIPGQRPRRPGDRETEPFYPMPPSPKSGGSPSGRPFSESANRGPPSEHQAPDVVCYCDCRQCLMRIQHPPGYQPSAIGNLPGVNGRDPPNMRVVPGPNLAVDPPGPIPPALSPLPRTGDGTTSNEDSTWSESRDPNIRTHNRSPQSPSSDQDGCNCDCSGCPTSAEQRPRLPLGGDNAVSPPPPAPYRPPPPAPHHPGLKPSPSQRPRAMPSRPRLANGPPASARGPSMRRPPTMPARRPSHQPPSLQYTDVQRSGRPTGLRGDGPDMRGRPVSSPGNIATDRKAGDDNGPQRPAASSKAPGMYTMERGSARGPARNPGNNPDQTRLGGRPEDHPGHGPPSYK